MWTASANKESFLCALQTFKSAECNENRLIIEILRTTLKDWLRPVILDVGAGLGDIADCAFPDVEAVLLDLNVTPNYDNKLHQMVVGDFFDFDPKCYKYPRTLLLSHVLQYLDGNLRKLRAKMADLAPEVVIEVTNDNVGTFGAIMYWSKKHIAGANPEMRCVYLDPRKYELRNRIPFRAQLKCASFDIMARHFLTLLIDAPISPSSYTRVYDKLRRLVSEPTIMIEQTVFCYERN